MKIKKGGQASEAEGAFFLYFFFFISLPLSGWQVKQKKACKDGVRAPFLPTLRMECYIGGTFQVCNP